MSLPAVVNHLLQSTLFAVAIAGLCWLLRKNAARTRFWLWTVASVKFLVPFSLLVSIGQRVELPAPSAPAAVRALSVERMNETVFPVGAPVMTPARRLSWSYGLGLVWAIGFAAVVWRRAAQWRALRAALRTASPLPLALPITAWETSERIEPGIAGIFRPVLLLPRGLMESLTEGQFAAILAHEMCHVRERDNLTAAVHMGVEAAFWFHPMVWWIGARMIDERERACDESVVAEGREREEYARGVLTVCSRFAATSLPCAAGITGSDLKRRMREIMTGAVPMRLSTGRRALLGLAALAAAIGPLVLGVLQAQTAPENYRFEVASIRPSSMEGTSTHINTSNTRLTTKNTHLLSLITFAYGVQAYQISGGPGWLRDKRFDLSATYDSAEEDAGAPARQAGRNERIRARLRNLLAERFQLVLREEKKELPVYKLAEDKDGTKLKADPKGGGNLNVNQNNGNGSMRGDGISIPHLCTALSGILGRPVIDETGISGVYAVELKWSSDGAGDQGPSIYTAIREQLGLRLESGKGPVTSFVIERAELPSEN